MELIEALEQLTLEVRNHASSNASLPSEFNHITQIRNNTQDYAPEIENHPRSNASRHSQLTEFDSSIDTLLAQITDLELIEPPNVSWRRDRFIHPKSILNDQHLESSLGGSMETSQEEDSDCSSQQSNFCTARISQHGNVIPLVRDLLRRDLSAITDTVRKISQILALGKEIESIYKNNFFTDTNQHLRQHQQSNLFKQTGKYLDLSYIRSLCETFINLSASEPYIRDLPTVVRYISYCEKLMIQVNSLLNLHSTSTAKSVDNSRRYEQQNSALSTSRIESDCDEMRSLELEERGMSCVRHQDNPISGNSHDEYDNDNDISSSFDRQHLTFGTWTENKLYIDHQSNN